MKLNYTGTSPESVRNIIIDSSNKFHEPIIIPINPSFTPSLIDLNPK